MTPSYYCRECHRPVDTQTDMIDGHPNLFECKNCGHPHSLGELIESDVEPPIEEDFWDGDDSWSE